MIVLNVYKLRDDLEMPTYGTSLANCFDLSFQPTSNIVKGFNKWNSPIVHDVNEHGEISINPGERLLIPTGLVFKLEQRITVESYSDVLREFPPLQTYSIRLHPRSGLSLKRGLVLANSEGIVDVDYQEEVFVLLTNISEMSATIKKDDRIAQAEVVSNIPAKFVVLNSKPEKHSERAGGFGSTGIQTPPVQRYAVSNETPPMEEWKVDGPTNFG